MSDYLYTLEFKVRDYECDLQGIVNNSVYQNYLEHCRHEFLLHKHLDFAALAREHVNLVVTRIELDYKTPLRSGDNFWVGLNFERKGQLRVNFLQDIYRSSDQQLCLRGLATVAAINENGKPFYPPQLDALFE